MSKYCAAIVDKNGSVYLVQTNSSQRSPTVAINAASAVLNGDTVVVNHKDGKSIAYSTNGQILRVL